MKYGLLGRKLSHSLSVPIHRAFFERRRLADSYELLELEPDQVRNLRALMEAEGFGALNVTIPYKQAVMPLCDELTDSAQRVGAVNTLLRKGGRLIGHNTDWYGFEALLAHAGIEPKGRVCAVLGATGGAAKAATQALRAGGAELYLVSRQGPMTYDDLSRADFDLLVNCTPVGMFPDIDASPVPREVAARADVLDMIYNPAETALMANARAAGRRAENGLYMLVAQAVAAEAFWRGEPIDRDAIRFIYAQMRGIALIGLPGSGKTTLGQGLAALIGRPFVDLDRAIERETGRTIPELFKQGEACFRDAESAAVRRHAGQYAVLSCGGGVVKRDENVRALRAGGLVIFLDRPTCRILSDIDVSGRPLLAGGAARLYALERERRALYERAAHITVKNDAGPEEALQALARAVKTWAHNG